MLTPHPVALLQPTRRFGARCPCLQMARSWEPPGERMTSERKLDLVPVPTTPLPLDHQLSAGSLKIERHLGLRRHETPWTAPAVAYLP